MGDISATQRQISTSEYGARTQSLVLLSLSLIYMDGLVKDCGISSALPMEILQSCTKPSTWYILEMFFMTKYLCHHISRVSCQKGPTRHAYAWQIGPFWQDILDLLLEFCT